MHITRLISKNLNQFFCCGMSFSPFVHKYNDLFSHSQNSFKLRIYDIIHDIVCSLAISEIVEKFSRALSYLRMQVRELTGDMNLTK